MLPSSIYDEMRCREEKEKGFHGGAWGILIKFQHTTTNFPTFHTMSCRFSEDNFFFVI